MAREGLNHALVDGFRRATRLQEAVTLRHVTVQTDGRTHHVQVSIEPLTEPKDMRGLLLVVFTEVMPVPVAVPTAGKGKRKGKPDVDAPANIELLQALEQARGEAHLAREDAQVSQEELTAANEELQSINEELQSTNEELTTSKEELQSMNEEMQTVNHELKARLDELTLASSDMTNLLNSTSIATLFLDNELLVRRFTTPTASIIHLIPTDVGRPITDIVSALDFADMETRAREVLRSLAVMEREIATNDGRWFSVRIMPYRTHDDRIDGLVLTFTDITKAKELEAALRAAQDALRQRLATQGQETSDTDHLATDRT
jgi:two-component system CheB/CheR fusion protein